MNLKETLRYLGYKGGEADRLTLKLAEDCWRELEQKTVKRTCFREFPLSFREGRIHMGCFETVSTALEKNLRDCRQVVLFAATLGVWADHLIRRYNRLQVSKAVVMQAAAAAMLEDYCDQVYEELRKEYENKGLYLRPRFSPGYGDFSILHQREILLMADTARRIGLAMTEGSMLAPTKSVTALIGLSKENQDCNIKGCEACEKTDCAFRRLS